MGHNASSARHAHEAEMNKQVTLALADRAQNPNTQDIFRLYNKWRLGSSGKRLFEKLQEAIDSYNEQNEKENTGGKAVLQWYDGQAQSSGASDSEDEVRPPRKKKKKTQKP